MKTRPAMATLVSALLLTTPALAQSPAPLPGFQLERMEFNPSAEGSLVVGTGALRPAGELRVSLLAHYEHAPLTFFRSDRGHFDVVKNRQTAHVLAAYSATNWLELGVQLPLVVKQDAANLSNLGISAPSSFGLSTPHVHARLGLLAERSGNPVDLALEVGTGLPLGNGQALARNDGFRFMPKVMMGSTLGWFKTGVEASLLLQPSVTLSRDAGQVRDELGNELRLGTSLSTTNQGLRGELAVRGALPLVRSPASAEALAGARYLSSQGWELFALGGMGFGGTPGTPQFRAIAGISFGNSPRQKLEPAAPLAQHTPDTSDVDGDRDGVTDTFDNCPRAAGPVENQGCPGARQLVVITQNQLRILDTIYFEFNKARIQPQSFGLLDQVASVLQEHPEITLVSIDGHTDNVGSAGYNDKLSLARSSAVRQYLIEKGVHGARLASRGFGFSQPATSNATASGRDFNRRVEFNIVSLERGNARAAGPRLSRR
ncbi:MAG TPA: OmpA family protein [Myxococcaceae bacterium]|jgi:outer membrane protein OmpA-like peptidoglycan-associated protein